MDQIVLPDPHEGQMRVFRNRGLRNAVVCGRGFGKTTMINLLAMRGIELSQCIGVFTPEQRQWTPIFDAFIDIFRPLVKSSNQTKRCIIFKNGARADFWHVDDNPLAGRGREYDLILMDEAAFGKKRQMFDTFMKSIVSTTRMNPLAEFWVFSTPNGVDDDEFLYYICHNSDQNFIVHRASSAENPAVSREFLKKEKERMPPDVYAQEIEAKFIDWSGSSFFDVEKLFIDGNPVQFPQSCDYVYAVMDSAIKSGPHNDGTAIIYFAFDKYVKKTLYILDYDLIQVNANLLVDLFPNNILKRLDYFENILRPRMGNSGVFVEDKGSGTILLQESARVGWNAKAIDSVFTAIGKDKRALSIASDHNVGLIKITDECFNKTVMYKGSESNHLVKQISSFILCDPKAQSRSDDLLDCYCYGVNISFGGNK